MSVNFSFRKVRHARAVYHGEQRFCVCVPNELTKEYWVCTANLARVTCPVCVRVLNELKESRRERSP